MTSNTIATVSNHPVIESSEIAPGLHVGSRPIAGPFLAMAGFHVVVLCACDFQPPAAHYPLVEIGRVPIDDAELTSSEIDRTWKMSRILSKRIRAGAKVLVTCNHGRNRSGLVAAMTLMRLTGCKGAQALQRVRLKRRSPFGPALTNPSFVRFLLAL